MHGYAQSFPKEWVAGHIQRGDTAVFFFSPQLYGVANPERVILTGSFRSWSQDMNDPTWQLAHLSDSLWSLAIPNHELAIIPPQAEFKYRINDGIWLSPPVIATNERGGNLVFLPHIIPPMLHAEIRRSGHIWVAVHGTERPLAVNAYQLLDGKGQEIPLQTLLPNEGHTGLLIASQRLDYRRLYQLRIPSKGLQTWVSFDAWYREMYSDRPLGAEVDLTAGATSFRLFAPRAEAIKLYLYKGKDDTEAYQTLEMQLDENGVWEIIANENLAGVWYDFTVHGPEEPGSSWYEQVPVHISDPYCRISDDSWGKSCVALATTPATPLADGRPPMEDVIAYEVHVQDFTDLLPVAEDLKGTIPAFFESGLTNSRGEAIGFDYLVDLGVNVVHLMPVQEFLHYKDEHWKPAFHEDEFMIEQGIAEENYQWGYRTSHAFAVETRFRRRGTEPGAEREQFRDLVQAFHDRGMAVIIDIVPNHSAENMDDDRNNGNPLSYYFHWNVLDPLYYYRTQNLEKIGEYGNEIKFENRPMVQRWLIDQCQHWIDEFGIDGFRIDLAGQIDRQTLTKLKEALDDDVIMYGEPWIGSYDPDFENNISWDWYKHNSPITFFQDDSRNAFKGPTGTPHAKEIDQGYAGGNYQEKEKVKAALTNTFPDDKTPTSGINYLDIHDNWALADRFAEDNWDGRFGVDEDRYKIAALLLYTSLGPIVTHGGTEMMRSKGLAELKETVKLQANGTRVFLHGKRDTYNMRAANQFIWENLGKTKEDEDCHCDYKGMHAFWRGLNHFRLSEIGKIFRQDDHVHYRYYQWLDTINP